MNIPNITLRSIFTIRTSRRALGLSLAALTGLGLFGCDDAMTGEELRELEASEDEDAMTTGADFDPEQDLVDDAAPMADSLEFHAEDYGDLRLEQSGSTLKVYSDDQLVEQLSLSGVSKLFWYGTSGADDFDARDVSIKIRAEGFEGGDRILTGSGHDAIYGGMGDDMIGSFSGNDYIEGNQGDDYIEAGAGDDHVLGGDQEDEIRGGTGSDVIEGGAHRDLIEGNEGDDFIFPQRIHVPDSQYVDKIHGGDGVDYAYGVADDDKIDAWGINARAHDPDLFCRLFDGKYITIRSKGNGEYVSAGNNQTDYIGIYLHTEPTVGPSEKFFVSCWNGGTKLVWRRPGYGLGTVWAGSMGDEYGTNEIPNGVFAGPNGESDLPNLSHHFDALVMYFLHHSLEDALDSGYGSINMPFYDPVSATWTFASPYANGPWEVGSHITYDTDESYDLGNQFVIEQTWT